MAQILLKFRKKSKWNQRRTKRGGGRRTEDRFEKHIVRTTKVYLATLQRYKPIKFSRGKSFYVFSETFFVINIFVIRLFLISPIFFFRINKYIYIYIRKIGKFKSSKITMVACMRSRVREKEGLKERGKGREREKERKKQFHYFRSLRRIFL